MRRFTVAILVVAMAGLFIGGPAVVAKKKPKNEKHSAKIEDLINKGEFQKAIDLAKKFEKKGKVTEGLYIDLGDAYYQLKDYPNAIAAFEKAEEQNPFGTKAILYEASCYHQMKNNDKVIDAYKRALEIDPGLNDAHVSLGRLYEEQGKPELALKEYETVYENNPDRKGLAYSIGVLNYGQGHYDKAETYFEKAALNSVGDSNVYLALGQNQLKLKDYTRAAASLEKFVKLTDRKALKPAVLGMVAVCYEKLNNYNKALTTYDRILALRPNYAKALLGKGNALLQLKEYPKAASVLKSYLKHSQNTDKKKEVEDTLKQLKKIGVK